MAATGSTSRRSPAHFGKYTLLERLAVGGMAEIFLARQKGLEGFEKKIVIKRIRPHLSKQSSFVKMFLNEAKLAAQLNHPNIVQIYDLGKINESYFIAMEYVHGRDMRRILRQCDTLSIPFPMVYALKVASSVCEGLYYANQKTDETGRPLEIVHRDITPENIFVSFDGTVKVLDFGIAKAANQIEQTQVGQIKGKLRYMSPEQCTGKHLDNRSDLFSLGVVLYEWLTGFKLFTGESDVAILKTISEGKINAPSYFKSDIPPAVEAIVMKALEKDREKRYQSAWEMQYDLDRFLSQYEFSPSNIHLSNFLKQLFAEEMDAEKGKYSHPPPAPVEEIMDPERSSSGRFRSEAIDMTLSVVSSTEADTKEKFIASPLSLQVFLQPADLEALTGMARRHDVPIESLVGDIISNWLKYR